MTQAVEAFIDDLSNWYVRLSRRRFWRSESDEDKQSAYATLYEVLVTLTKLIAPVLPFTAEEMYQNLVRFVAVRMHPRACTCAIGRRRISRLWMSG